MSVLISDDMLTRLDYRAEEFIIDFACFLYEKRRISMGKASALANMNRMEFQLALKERDIYLNYNEDDLAIDLENLGISL